MSIQYQGRTLSEAEALTHVWDVEEVMEVMNRRVYYAIAQELVGRPDGQSTAMWRREKLAADFVKEAGGWKIWHLVIANDCFNPAGTPHEAQPLADQPGADAVRSGASMGRAVPAYRRHRAPAGPGVLSHLPP